HLEKAGIYEEPSKAWDMAHLLMLRYGTCVREMAYEMVRRDSFPDRPSRSWCIFLIPPGEGLRERIAHWYREVDGGRIYRVRASGNFLWTDDSLLVDINASLEKM